MKVVLVGGVNSSAVTLQKLIEHDMDIVMVYGYEPKTTQLVSGYHNFSALCADNGINYMPFQKINDHTNEIL